MSARKGYEPTGSLVVDLAFAFAISLTLFSLLLTSGCTERLTGPDVIRESRTALNGITSYVADFYYETQVGSRRASSSKARVEVDIPSESMHITFKDGGDVTEGYISGDKAYLYAEGEGWRQASVSEVFGASALSFDPLDIASVAKYGEDAEITGETDSSITLEFDLTGEYIKENEEHIRSMITSELGHYGQLTEENVERIVQAYIEAPVTCEYMVSRKTYLPESILLSIGPVEFGDTSPFKLISKTTVQEYNQPVDTDVPREALDSPPLRSE